LKQHGFADRSRVALRLSDGCVAVPINANFIKCYSTKNEFYGISFTLDTLSLQKSRWIDSSPKQNLLNSIKLLCEGQLVWSADLDNDIPESWEKHMDMLILPANCFKQETWLALGGYLAVQNTCIVFLD
jgi:hypothetical protein